MYRIKTNKWSCRSGDKKGQPCPQTGRGRGSREPLVCQTSCIVSPNVPKRPQGASAQLVLALAHLLGHLAGAGVLQLLGLVVMGGHLQQPRAVDLDHLGTKGTGGGEGVSLGGPGDCHGTPSLLGTRCCPVGAGGWLSLSWAQRGQGYRVLVDVPSSSVPMGTWGHHPITLLLMGTWLRGPLHPPATPFPMRDGGPCPHSGGHVPNPVTMSLSHAQCPCLCPRGRVPSVTGHAHGGVLDPVPNPAATSLSQCPHVPVPMVTSPHPQWCPCPHHCPSVPITKSPCPPWCPWPQSPSPQPHPCPYGDIPMPTVVSPSLSPWPTPHAHSSVPVPIPIPRSP